MATRLYSLYERDGRRWRRISVNAYPKARAVLVYQSDLLAPILEGVGNERSLRPVKDEFVTA